VGIGKQIKGVLERIEILWAHDYGSRSSIPSEDDTLMLLFHPIHDLGQMSLDLRQRQRLRHDHYYSHLIGDVESNDSAQLQVRSAPATRICPPRSNQSALPEGNWIACPGPHRLPRNLHIRLRRPSVLQRPRYGAAPSRAPVQRSF
jgi:hypothetical protein